MDFKSNFNHAYGSNEFNNFDLLLITLFILIVSISVGVWGYKKIKGLPKNSENYHWDILGTMLWGGLMISLATGLILTLEGV